VLVGIVLNPVAAVAFVAHHPLGTAFGSPAPCPLGHQLGQPGGLMPVAWRQGERPELAMAFGPDVAFGTEAAWTAAKGFGVRSPFFAPAACWWARTMVPSPEWTAQTSCPLASACGGTTAKRRAQIPAWRQR
jgi:hypothetical protein